MPEKDIDIEDIEIDIIQAINVANNNSHDLSTNFVEGVKRFIWTPIENFVNLKWEELSNKVKEDIIEEVLEKIVIEDWKIIKGKEVIEIIEKIIESRL